jgi:DNA-binding transcriptional MerR regulator
MRVSELSRRSGVSLPTIKYYIREGVLPAGDKTGPNQADYGDVHLDRLRLVEVLKQQAGLSIAAIQRIARALDTRDVSSATTRTIIASLPPLRQGDDAVDPGRRDAIALQLDALLSARDWYVEHDAAAYSDTVRALAAIEQGWRPLTAGELARYIGAAEQIAAGELPRLPEEFIDDPTDALLYSVLGTVLVEPFILAIRRLAHFNRVHQLYREAGIDPFGEAG